MQLVKPFFLVLLFLLTTLAFPWGSELCQGCRIDSSALAGPIYTWPNSTMLQQMISTNGTFLFQDDVNLYPQYSTGIKLEIRTQNKSPLRLAYDVNNYVDFSVGASGGLTINATGGVVVSSNGNVIIRNGNVGIGTTSPLATLHVSSNVVGTPLMQIGNAAVPNALVVSTNGYVGIGTTSPVVQMHLDKSDINSGPTIRLTNASAVGSNYGQLWLAGSTGHSIAGWPNATILEGATSGGLVLSGFGSGGILFQTGTSRLNRMSVDIAGNVGIGSATPDTRLDVRGGITSQQTSAGLVYGANIINTYYAIPPAGEAVGIAFGVGGLSNRKGALVYKREGDYGIGDFHFLQNTAIDASAPTLSQAVVTIKSNGNVGLGTTAPGAKLSISLDSANDPLNYGRGIQITGGTSGGQQISFIRNGNVARSLGYLPNGNVFGFGSGNSTDSLFTPSYMSFDVNGNVGIGTTSPGTKLQVSDGGSSGSSELLSLKTAYSSDSSQKALTWRDGDNITGQIDTRYGVGGVMSMVFGHLYNSGYQTGDLITILGNGNVGIGTTTPGQKLDVSGNLKVYGALYGNQQGSMIAISAGGDGWYGIGQSTVAGGATSVGGQYPYTISMHTGLAFSAHSAYGGIRFYNQNYPTTPMTATPVMAIINGYVGIGTTTPARKLSVNGDAGGTTAWYNDSDERLKKNIVTIPNALDKVQQLRGVNFEWKDTTVHPTGNQIGFIAQEAKVIIPEVVSQVGEYYSIQYAPITALLTQAIKEQQLQIKQLKSKNESDIIALKAEKDAELASKNVEIKAQQEQIQGLKSSHDKLKTAYDAQLKSLKQEIMAEIKQLLAK